MSKRNAWAAIGAAAILLAAPAAARTAAPTTASEAKAVAKAVAQTKAVVVAELTASAASEAIMISTLTGNAYAEASLCGVPWLEDASAAFGAINNAVSSMGLTPTQLRAAGVARTMAILMAGDRHKYGEPVHCDAAVDRLRWLAHYAHRNLMLILPHHTP